MRTLTATAAFGQSGHFVARITGRCPKFTFNRTFIGRKEGKRGDSAVADVDTDGLYEECDVDRKGRKTNTYRVILDCPGLPLTEDAAKMGHTLRMLAVDKAEAMKIAKALDEGRDLREVVEFFPVYGEPGIVIDYGYRLLSPRQAARAAEGQTQASALAACWRALEPLPQPLQRKVLADLKARVNPPKEKAGGAVEPNTEAMTAMEALLAPADGYMDGILGRVRGLPIALYADGENAEMTGSLGPMHPTCAGFPCQPHVPNAETARVLRDMQAGQVTPVDSIDGLLGLGVKAGCPMADLLAEEAAALGGTLRATFIAAGSGGVKSDWLRARGRNPEVIRAADWMMAVEHGDFGRDPWVLEYLATDVDRLERELQEEPAVASYRRPDDSDEGLLSVADLEACLEAFGPEWDPPPGYEWFEERLECARIAREAQGNPLPLGMLEAAGGGEPGGAR